MPELTAGISSDTGVLVAAVDVLLGDVLASVCISVLLCLWILRALDISAPKTFGGLDTGWACFLELTVATKSALHVDFIQSIKVATESSAETEMDVDKLVEKERDYNCTCMSLRRTITS